MVLTSMTFAKEAHADETLGPSMSVKMGFIGEKRGDGVYSTRALSISIGAGEPGFQGMVVGNGNSVATVVGSSGTRIIIPDDREQEGDAFESTICASNASGECPLLQSRFPD